MAVPLTYLEREFDPSTVVLLTSTPTSGRNPCKVQVANQTKNMNGVNWSPGPCRDLLEQHPHTDAIGAEHRHHEPSLLIPGLSSVDIGFILEPESRTVDTSKTLEAAELSRRWASLCRRRLCTSEGPTNSRRGHFPLHYGVCWFVASLPCACVHGLRFAAASRAAKPRPTCPTFSELAIAIASPHALPLHRSELCSPHIIISSDAQTDVGCSNIKQKHRKALKSTQSDYY